MKETLDRILFFIAVAVTVIVGLALAGYSARNIYWSFVNPSWPTVQGQVVSSEIRMISGSKGSWKWPRPEVKYRFSVDGIEYWGDRITFGYERDTQEYADAMTLKYPLAAPVAVHYHPRDPYLNCLETGGRIRGHLFVILCGLVLCVIAALPMIFKLPSRYGGS